jgi:hypothetical protein
MLPGLAFDMPPLNEPNHYEVYLKEGGLGIPSVGRQYMGTNPTNQIQEVFALDEGPVESCIEYFVAEEAIRVMGAQSVAGWCSDRSGRGGPNRVWDLALAGAHDLHGCERGPLESPALRALIRRGILLVRQKLAFADFYS